MSVGCFWQLFSSQGGKARVIPFVCPVLENKTELQESQILGKTFLIIFFHSKTFKQVVSEFIGEGTGEPTSVLMEQHQLNTFTRCLDLVGF